MSNAIKPNFSAVFPRFNYLPDELRRDIWLHALPGPRIVFVQRLLTSGQDAEEEWNAFRTTAGPHPPAPSYFMSPCSSESIRSLLQTCKESRSVARKNYTLLLPVSSTWFSFSMDFLSLDFGLSSHVMHFDPRTFAPSIPEPFYLLNSRFLSRYLRPKFDEELAKKVKNLAINSRIIATRTSEFVNELLAVFAGVEVLVLADELCSVCREQGEELVWLRGQLGDEMSSVSQLKINARGGEEMHESEIEKKHRVILRELQLWRESDYYHLLEDEGIHSLLREWKKATKKNMPTIVRKCMTTANLKNRLLQICDSEDNFKELQGLDWGFVEGLHKYHGSLNLSQQIAFLYLVAERISDDFDRNCKSCSFDGGVTMMTDIPVLLAKIDALDSEMHLHNAEEMV